MVYLVGSQQDNTSCCLVVVFCEQSCLRLRFVYYEIRTYYIGTKKSMYNRGYVM